MIRCCVFTLNTLCCSIGHRIHLCTAFNKPPQLRNKPLCSPSATDLKTESLDLAISDAGDTYCEMPWFRKSFRIHKRKQQKIRKKDISEPTDFRHCYHASFDLGSESFAGLPPQWTSLVSPPKSVVKPKEKHLKVEFETLVESSEEESTDATVITTSTTLALVKRPSPIVRGSDSCYEETLKYIKKHYGSVSSPEDTENQEEFLDIHFGSRSGSLMQLGSGGGGGNSSSPVNRGKVVSYTSSSTSSMSRSNDPLPTAFFLSAPNDLVRSDLGLYNEYENTSECGTSTHLSHKRINSPSESSGYFGSTMSSLYNSRMSSFQQISSPNHQNTSFSPSRPLHPYESHETWVHPQIHQGQRFSSLQRPVRYHRESGSHLPRHHFPGQGSAMLTQNGIGHYGTTPRVNRGAGGSGYMDSSRIQERTLAEHDKHHYHNHHHHHHHEIVGQKSSNSTTATAQPPHKRERRKMTNEQFRTTMELLVNPTDPRRDLIDFVKIGEGSTGVVYTAQSVSQNGIVVAVKKMHLWKQQRRELLFNEVSL